MSCVTALIPASHDSRGECAQSFICVSGFFPYNHPQALNELQRFLPRLDSAFAIPKIKRGSTLYASPWMTKARPIPGAARGPSTIGEWLALRYTSICSGETKGSAAAGFGMRKDDRATK